MPGPFPGMDPYLEARALWPDLHQRLITYSADALQALVRPRYHARIGERLYLVPPQRSIYPDIAAVQRPQRPDTHHRPSGSPRRTAGIPADEPTLVFALPEEIREPFIEIVDLAGHGEVVTVIEVLSPANKAPGEGHELYGRKRDEILASHTNLVEIDLLRAGVHTVAVPRVRLAPYAPWHYLISVSRAERRDRFEVYFIRLQERLPRIAVPLRAPDPDVVLDLQAIFDQCYERGAYADLVDYSADPDPPPLP